MDPNTLPTPNFDLPKPHTPEAGAGVNPNIAPSEAPQPSELRNMEIPVGGTAVASPAPTVPAPAMPVAPAAGQVPVQPPTSSAPLPIDQSMVADDGDLIEKEWVNRAKAIVDKTRNDPHAQNKELNKVKAEYIRKRYNREVKIGDE